MINEYVRSPGRLDVCVGQCFASLSAALLLIVLTHLRLGYDTYLRDEANGLTQVQSNK